MKLAEKGWLCPGWPREYGGMGLSSIKQMILTEEFERYGVARTNDHGIVMVGPLLIQYGTEEQKQPFLPKILSGENIWCQGYCEPNAGSDLAACAPRRCSTATTTSSTARRPGPRWRWTPTGSSCWSRTDKAAKKQEGISFLLVPTEDAGISVRPIITLDMHDEFCETFFDNVRVPKENLVGPLEQRLGRWPRRCSATSASSRLARLSGYALLAAEELAERHGRLGRRGVPATATPACGSI